MEMTRAEKAARVKKVVHIYGSFLFEQIDSVPITFVDNRTNTIMVGRSVSFNVINCERPDGFYQAYEISSQHLPESIVDRILMYAEKWIHINIENEKRFDADEAMYQFELHAGILASNSSPICLKSEVQFNWYQEKLDHLQKIIKELKQNLKSNV